MTKYANRAMLVMFLLLSLAVTFSAWSQGVGQDDELTAKHPRVKHAIEVQETVTPTLMSIEDVIGTAVAEDDDGEIAMVIYVNLEGKHPAKTFKDLPKEIGGVRATAVITDPFRAMAGKPVGGVIPHRETEYANPTRYFRRMELRPC